MTNWDIGVINSLRNGGRCFDHVEQFGLKCCQLVSWDPGHCTPEIARTARASAQEAGVRITGLWSGVPGPAEWNFHLGPVTLGLVPSAYRFARVDALKRWADFAVELGAPAIITHAGFLPENMTDPDYEGVLMAIREVARHCKDRGLEFWFETGQETPVTLLRYIEACGTGNLGINLDTGNLIMYGKGNPTDSLDVFGKYVRNLHVKDGFYPTDPRELGREVAMGEGRVNFPVFFRRLKEVGFTGDLIIEREIYGEQQTRDIRKTVDKLRVWMAEF